MNTFADRPLHEPPSQTSPEELANPAQHPLHRKSLHWLNREPSRPWIATRRFAEAEITHLAVPPIRVKQDSSPVGDAGYHLACLLDGDAQYRCETGAFTQASGDIVLINGAEACEVTSPVSTRILRWSLPRGALVPMLPEGDHTTMSLPASRGLNRVLSRHAIELAREADNIPSEARHGVLLHLCSLVALAVELAADRPARRRGNYRAQVRQRILAHVETHLRDPDLTARRAAEDLGISARRLHAVLEDASLCFSDLVARRRVEQSLKLLEARQTDAMPITEIAYLSGFADLSTYYRRFRRYMHMTPGDWREGRVPRRIE